MLVFNICMMVCQEGETIGDAIHAARKFNLLWDIER